mgnify:FL=1
MIDHLTEENFLIFCAKIYDNPAMHSTTEFIEDLDRIKYIKKLITRYLDTGELKERLILNHIITLHNCFGDQLAKILFLKLENHYHLIKPFLIILNALPDIISNVGSHSIVHTDDISMDQTIIEALRKINNG